METTAMVAIRLAMFAVFALFVAFVGVMIESISTSTIRRNMIILIWGYGGDVVEWFCAIVCGIVAGIESFFHRDDEVMDALNH